MLSFERVVLDRGTFRLSADLAIPAGAHVAVMGPSGSGKSTLLDILCGFVAPSAGRVLWEGQDLTDRPPGQRPVAMLFQDNNLFPHLDVAANVTLGLRAGGRTTAAERAAVAWALDRVGLSDFAGRRPGTLSGGQRSRAALARVALQDRPIIALDEAFSALGPGLKGGMIDLLRDLAQARGATVLMVTHDPGDALRLGGGIVVVAHGVAAPSHPAAALLADPPPALRRYLGVTAGEEADDRADQAPGGT